MQTGLVKYDAMCKAIAACHTVDEANQIRAKARALEVYAKQALNTEAEAKCGEIRLRAEKRAGQLLKELKQNGTRAGHGGDRRSKSNSATLKTLPDLGITRDQASKWQQLAEIPDDEFEAELAQPGPKPTTHGILSNRKPADKPPQIDIKALNAWGRMMDFERLGLLEQSQHYLLDQMTDPMRDHVLRLAPAICRWLKGFQL